MPWLPLGAMTLATFSIGTNELMIQGLLPEIAAALGVSIPSAGLLVTGYALGVTIGGPIVAILTAKLPRKTILLMLMGVFILGNLMGALAASYPFLMLARVIASLCHGAFVGIGSVLVSELASADRRASAVAIMWAGFAGSSILGVPLGTALGQALGWRATFWAVTAVGVVALTGITAALPSGGRAPPVRLAGEFRVLADPKVLLALSFGALICAGLFGVMTYIAPLLRETAAIPPAALPLYLLVFGVGGVIGMQVGGRLADRKLMGSITSAFVVGVVVYLVLVVALRSAALAMVMMFVWGATGYFVAPPIQIRVVDVGRDAPNLASTLLQSSCNLGIAVGPLAAAAALSFGMSYALLPLLGAGVLPRRRGRRGGLNRARPARDGAGPGVTAPPQATPLASERRIFRRGAAAAHPGPGPIGGLALVGLDIGTPGLRLERGALIDDAELSVALDLADHDRLRHMVVWQHGHFEARRRLELLADHRLAHRVHVGRAGLLDRLGPHVEEDIGRFHRIIGDVVRLLRIGAPFRDERLVFRRIDRLEVAPRRQMTDERLGVDARQLLLADRERDHRDVGRLHALIAELLIERNVGVAVDRRNHRGLLA